MFSFGLLSGVWSLIANVSEHCLFHLHRRVGTPDNNPKENIRHSKHGESLKSRNKMPSNEGGRVIFYFINLSSLAVSLRTTRFNIQKFYMLALR
jgi:hypothetical protein